MPHRSRTTLANRRASARSSARRAGSNRRRVGRGVIPIVPRRVTEATKRALRGKTSERVKKARTKIAGRSSAKKKATSQTKRKTPRLTASQISSPRMAKLARAARARGMTPTQITDIIRRAQKGTTTSRRRVSQGSSRRGRANTGSNARQRLSSQSERGPKKDIPVKTTAKSQSKLFKTRFGKVRDAIGRPLTATEKRNLNRAGFDPDTTTVSARKNKSGKLIFSVKKRRKS